MNGCADVNNIIYNFATALSSSRLEEVLEKTSWNTWHENILWQSECEKANCGLKRLALHLSGVKTKEFSVIIHVIKVEGSEV